MLSVQLIGFWRNRRARGPATWVWLSWVALFGTPPTYWRKEVRNELLRENSCKVEEVIHLYWFALRDYIFMACDAMVVGYRSRGPVSRLVFSNSSCSSTGIRIANVLR